MPDVPSFWGGFVLGMATLGGFAFLLFLGDLLSNHRCPYTTDWGKTRCILPRDHPQTEHQRSIFAEKEEVRG